MDQGRSSFRNSLLTAAILALLYIAVSSIPLPWLTGVSATAASAALRFCFLFLAYWILSRDGHRFVFKPRFALWTAPLFLLCFSNLLVVAIDSANRGPFNGSSLAVGFLFDLSVAIAEEAVFRESLQGTLRKRFGPLVSVLIASGLFALCHGVNAISLGVGALAQIGYTFVLGFVLGVLYEKTGLLPAILLHFLFDFVQTDLFLALGGGTWDLTFYLVNIALGAAVVVYALVCLLLSKKKAEVQSATSE